MRYHLWTLLNVLETGHSRNGEPDSSKWAVRFTGFLSLIFDTCQNSNDLLETLLPESLHPCIQFVKPYLLTCFGSFTRMDYGTGHETSFGLFLLCLTLVRYFQPIPEEERHLVFVVFMRYLRLCWRLQDVYRLEPAGSHGVWGLDDYCFLGYLFGSGQLRGRQGNPMISKSSFTADPRSGGHSRQCNIATTTPFNKSLFSPNHAYPWSEKRSVPWAFPSIIFSCCKRAKLGESQFRYVQDVRGL